jgi:GDPmannose 4,6-dehydratase
VREFVQRAAAELGITIAFSGEGQAEIGTIVAIDGSQVDQPRCKVGDVVVRVDPRYFRPTEVETLLGDASKARQKLGWTPKITLAELVAEMVQADFTSARRDNVVRGAGFQAYDYNE